MTKKKIARTAPQRSTAKTKVNRALTTRSLPRVARAPKNVTTGDAQPKKPALGEPGRESLLPPCTVAEAAAVVDSMRAAGWKPEAAGPERTPAQAPTPKQGYLFEGDGIVNRKAPLTKLLAAMFESTNAPEFEDPAKQLMARVLCSIADECDLLNGLNNGMDNSSLVERVTFRLEYRAQMAVELARRIDAGEMAS